MTKDAIADLLDPTVLQVGINLGNILLVTGKKPNGDPEG
ncbi:MAG TPA: ABC transporter substrate-binding protein, partial [Rhodospirillaceae bacterium]|nr:ABC transporter substrate-binding protein [Rhodospirillaceae bacterium]